MDRTLDSACSTACSLQLRTRASCWLCVTGAATCAAPPDCSSHEARRPDSQAPALGSPDTPWEDDPRRDPGLLGALERIAPGTPLRQAIDDVIRSHEGALIVVGDPNELSFLFSGGMRLDQ